MRSYSKSQNEMGGHKLEMETKMVIVKVTGMKLESELGTKKVPRL